MRARASSFAKVAEAYLAEIKPVFAASSYRTKESRIQKYLLPKFDETPISDIGVKQIRPLLEECKSHGAWAAIHVKGDLGAWLSQTRSLTCAGCSVSRSARAKPPDPRANSRLLPSVTGVQGLSGGRTLLAPDCPDSLSPW
ncbi:N-terminal phage integrase SAM-like domain-containing protein [Cupriavidus malaysiensis]|uniref:N-terminal phage integrase SAM-like domain-containing protein n=1 Tax=Cupriavidus malaysiensis TaxID=367825 RepID=UPI001F249FD0|nr:N-terminal phage integrase SAM-like domain-containing protein [Cupriavidus malaysiensis]